MEEKDPKKSQSYRPVKEPSKEVKEYYENYFRRNQNKFMRRSKLEESHLGSEFNYDDKTFKLLGAVDPVHCTEIEAATPTFPIARTLAWRP